MKLNRASRRRAATEIVNEVIKGRAAAVGKKQYGFGLVVTTRMIAVVFWRWTWVPWDRRLA